MASTVDQAQDQLHTINQALLDGTLENIELLLQDLTPADIAHLMHASPPRERDIIWLHTQSTSKQAVLQYLNEEVRAEFLSHMATSELVALARQLETDDSADLLQELPKAVMAQVLRSMDAQDRQRVESVLSYNEDTAGGLMNTDTITVRPHVSLDVVLRYLRRHKQLPDMTDNILVVDEQDGYLGSLPLTKLLVTDPCTTVEEAMSTEEEPIPASTPASEVASLFERYDLVSAAVVDAEGRLLGRITVDDVLDVIRDTADHNLLGQVGLDEEDDPFAPVLKTSRRRAVWLGINLITAFAASAVIGLFDETLDKVVALAILMPIVANMGGIAGTQTLTLIIRGMAIKQIGWANLNWLLRREIGAGLVNGLCWALLVGIAAALWFDEHLIGYLIASAMLINLLIAALAGTIIPFILKRFNVDPALAGGVILTTITDIMGFLTFLGLATLCY